MPRTGRKFIFQTKVEASLNDHVEVKTEMLQMRLMEKRRELVCRAGVDALIDGIPSKLCQNPCVAPRSPSGQQDDGEHSRHAENDGGDPGNFDVGNPS